jgi:arylsulfatase A-like enzyme
MGTGKENDDSKPTRRDILKMGVSALGSLPVAEQLQGSTQRLGPENARKPNFVFFLGEGLRPDEFSIAGNRILHTPHMDRIAREGITFRNAFVVNALCLPSRASVLTGLYSHSTGAIDNHERSIPAEVPIISDTLQDAGYEVAFFGKAHIKGLSHRNWDYFLGVEDAGANYYHPAMVESQHGSPKPPHRYEGYVDDLLTDQALEWLNQDRKRPFCLFLWFIVPHAPFYRARRYLDLYNGVTIPKPSTFDDDLKGYPGKPRAFAEAGNKIGTTVEGDTARSLEELVKDHYAGVVDNDDNVGRIMETLERAGKLDDTAILLCSDHGFFLGEWRMYDKRFMHEPSIRVPLMVRYPRIVKAGSGCERMALNLDLAPTILDLAGLTVPQWMQGQSLMPLLKGLQPTTWRKDWLYEYYEYPADNRVKPHRGVRTDRYKLIHYYQAPEEFEFYDLQDDPGELQNLYGDSHYAELIRKLRDRIDELRKETGDA